MNDKEYNIAKKALFQMEKHFHNLCEFYRYYPDQGDIWEGSEVKFRLDPYVNAMSNLRIMLSQVEEKDQNK